MAVQTATPAHHGHRGTNSLFGSLPVLDVSLQTLERAIQYEEYQVALEVEFWIADCRDRCDSTPYVGSLLVEVVNGFHGSHREEPLDGM
jgi:hypothetical protein